MGNSKTDRKKRAKGCYTTALIVVLVVCVLIIVALKVTEKVVPKLEQMNYPLEYTDIIYRYAANYDVPKSVILAMIKVESNFDPRAVSNAGACGLMQLMPETFEWLASTLGEEVGEDDIFDPEMNIKYGTYYVSTLYAEFGNWENVYAAYNAGRGNVNVWLNDPQYSENGILTDIPFRETERHVDKLKIARAKYIELYFLGE